MKEHRTSQRTAYHAVVMDLAHRKADATGCMHPEPTEICVRTNRKHPNRVEITWDQRAVRSVQAQRYHILGL